MIILKIAHDISLFTINNNQVRVQIVVCLYKRMYTLVELAKCVLFRCFF